jgi:cobalt-zinc-cadmium efflux system outer membrane protein
MLEMLMKKCLSLSVSLFLLVVVGCLSEESFAQSPLTWREVRAKFEVVNPTLRAARIGIDESRAQEITAYLRPNPTFSVLVDQFHPNKVQVTNQNGVFEDSIQVASLSYLIERMNKRELRLESAQKGTAIATLQLADLGRSLLFTLRSAFIQVLQQKAILLLAEDNLAYYDQVLQVSGERFKAGDIAQIDLERLQLQRVTFESDLQTAEVNLRTAKIQLLTLLNDRTPIEQFDVTGAFDFSDQIQPLGEFRMAALAARPDLRAAVQSIDQAKTNHQLAVANSSTDPIIGVDMGRFASTGSPAPGSSPISYMGLSVSIPLRIFDRNQGEKVRTQYDITRNERVRDATEALVYSDVDSAHAALNSTLILLKPYKTKYLQQAVTVRDIVTFSYERGGASLLDFLQAQNDYRNVQRSYLTLVGSYLSAAAQLNLAVGREVIE